MIDSNKLTYEIPRSSISFRFSKAAIAFLCVTAGLCVVLVFSTLQNINRAEMLMEKFLFDKGRIILRSIEASNTASVRHLMGRDAWFDHLLLEQVKDETIHFISITSIDGTVVYQAGRPEQIPFTEEEQETLSTTASAVTRFSQKNSLFIISKRFQEDNDSALKSAMTDMGNREQKRIISIGLLTEQFDIARKQDVHHTLFMGAILLLVWMSGLYFLFLYQKMRQAGSMLADMKLYTESVLESIPVSLVAIDGNGRISSCNKNTEELTGQAVEMMQGKSLAEVFPVSVQHLCIAEKTLFDYPVDLENSDGTIKPVRVSCSPLISHTHEKIGQVLVIRDMSSIRAMELQLERSRRMAALGKMAAGIAHEIRNPLGTLRGFSQFFGSQAEGTEKSREYSELMIGEIDRLNQIVSGLLQFSNPRELQRQKVCLDALVAKVATLFQADLATLDVHFTWEKGSNIELFADPDLILQVLMNLLRNSIAATPKGGTISMKCASNEQSVFISVTDSGCGMSEQVREKMFDPFFTTHNTGTGLGLAVSHQIIEQHQGSFEVTTEVGVGTTVTLVFPLNPLNQQGV